MTVTRAIADVAAAMRTPVADRTIGATAGEGVSA